MSAKIIMVASGKGGTGKSTLSVLLGAALAAAGRHTLLIELDSGLRSVDIIAGVCGKTVYDIEDILSGRCDPDKAVVESPIYPGLSVVSAPYSGGEIRPEALRVMTSKMAPVFDNILIDTAAGLGAPFLAAKSVASMALIVITPDTVTMRDGRIVADELFDGGMPEVRLIINRVAVGRGARNPIKNLDECIDNVGAQLIGVVPRSDDIIFASAEGTALPELSLAKEVMESIAARLLGQDVPLVIK
ncbi:MAG: AAA family ATPase [Pygmaiobacter sp.]